MLTGIKMCLVSAQLFCPFSLLGCQQRVSFSKLHLLSTMLTKCRHGMSEQTFLLMVDRLSSFTLPSSILSGVCFDLFETSTSFRLILPGWKNSVVFCSNKSHKSILASRPTINHLLLRIFWGLVQTHQTGSFPIPSRTPLQPTGIALWLGV